MNIRKKISRLIRRPYRALTAPLEILACYGLVRRRLKRKTPGSRLSIVFIVQRTEVFSSVRTVFEAAVKAGHDARLLALPRCRQGVLDTADTSAAEFCRSIAPSRTIEALDRGSGAWFDLAAAAPDYIFLNVPYTSEYPAPYHISKMSAYSKICYVPYGYSLLRGSVLEGCFGSSLLKYAAFIFCDSSHTYAFCRRKTFLSEFCSHRRVYDIGYPRFDFTAPPRTSGRLSVLYLPRWTTPKDVSKGNEPSTFPLYKDFFLSLARKRPDIDIVIRPHPLMFPTFIKEGFMTESEIRSWCSAVADLPNMRLDTNADYMESLLDSDILVADITSILAEYFILQRPVIYLGSRANLTEEAGAMFDTFHEAHDAEALNECLTGLLNNIDSKKTLRGITVSQFRKKCGSSAGSRILKIIEDDRQSAQRA